MRTFLSLDRRLLNPQAIENAKLKVQAPVKDVENNPLFTQNMPWEIRIDNGYPNVIYDSRENIFHCYYTLFTDDKDTEGTTQQERVSRNYRPRMDRITSLAYARSKDGIHWEKPSLGFVEWRGSKENNLLFRYAHGTGVMLDERETDENRRYKMVTKVDIPDHGAHMAVGFSADGVHWGELIPWPKYNPQADSHNFPFWNEKENCYMLISRIWKDGIRITTISRSEDFIHWSEPQETLRGRGFEDQIYSMPVFKSEGIYLGLASLIHEGDRNSEDFDCVDCELTWSADGKKFDFACFDQPVISRGMGCYPDGEFDSSCIYASAPVMVKDDVWVYYMGGNGQHTNFRESSLGRARWESDKFACWMTAERISENADRKETIAENKQDKRSSILTTTTLTLGGEYIELLADISDPEKEWSLSASVHPVWTEKPYEGFEMEQSVVKKEGRWLRISWNEKILPGGTGCIRLKFENLKIWALRGELEYKGHRLWEGADMENEGM